MSAVPQLLVLAPNWLGDLIMALPALAALRAWMPRAQLTIAARRGLAPVLPLVPGVDSAIALEAPGGVRGLARLKADAGRMREGAFDAAVLLPNSFRAALLTWQAGIPERWGYAADLRGPLLTRAVPKPRPRPHQADYYTHLVRALGAPASPRAAALVIPEEAERRGAALLDEAGRQGAPLAGFAPGAAFGSAKRWPPARAGRVAAALARTRGLTPIFVGAKADAPAAREAVAAYRDAMGRHEPPAIDLTGRTDLATAAALLAMCRVVVSNDSGAMHLAAAVGTPVVAIFGPTDERATVPLPHDVTAGTPGVTVITGEAWCRPCHLRACPIDHRCMRSITVEQVAEAASGAARRGTATREERSDT